MYGYKFLVVKPTDGHIIIPGTPSDAIGNLALVKLEIPDDATVIYPVDKDYYCANFSASSLSHKDFYKMKRYVKAKKCRCNKAKFVKVIRYFSENQCPSNYFCGALLYSMTCDLQPSNLIFKSMWNPNFIYKFNEYVEPDGLDEDILWECSNGIHFCRTAEDAIDYIETCGYTIMDEEETK